MLAVAYQAIVVWGDEHNRSKTMVCARQVTLPSQVPTRLDTARLPRIDLTELALIESVLQSRYTGGGLQIICASSKSAAKLLATPMRDAAVAGPALREAHRRAGWYLAVEIVAERIGLDQSPVRHVLGRQTRGYQLLHERKTTIAALMRGGEPMAAGINDAFPQAMFVHAKEPEDIKQHHLHGQITLILVDSVVNTGKTIIDCVHHVRKLHATIRVVIVAGVVQVECLSENGLRQQLAQYSNLHFVALRHSDTKFIGSGTTDTGNRLFNTTHLP